MKNFIFSLLFLSAFSMLSADQYQNEPSYEERFNQNSNINAQQRGFRTDSTTTVSDNDIKTSLQKKLGRGWFSNGYESVKFDVKNGNVLLSGSVDTLADKKKVEDEVRAIDGVRAITNQINVSEKKSSSYY